METRQDFIVGALIVAAIAIVVGALVATSGWGERRYDLFLRVGSAEGITVDTRVIVQGLEVGRVKSIDRSSGTVALEIEPVSNVASIDFVAVILYTGTP